MPISERRLNLRYITEHYEKLHEVRQERQTVTADKPMILKPATNTNGEIGYTSKVKSRK